MDVYAFKQNLKTINNSTQTERLEQLNAETNRIERLDDFVGNSVDDLLDTLVAEIGLEFLDNNIFNNVDPFYALLDAGVADVLKTDDCEIRQSEFSLNKLAAGDDLRKQNGIGFDLQQTLTELVGELKSVRSQLKQQQKLNFELQEQIKRLKAIHTNIQPPLQEVQQLQIEQASTTEVSTQVHSKNAEISIATAHLQLEEPTSRKDNSKQSVHSLRQKQVGVNRKRKSTDDGKRHTRGVKTGKISLDTRDALKRRKRNRSGDEPKMYSCKECNKSFSFNCHLTRHLLIHTGQKPHKCQLCNKSFRFKSNLTQHLRIHTSQKPHKCQLCNKSFRFKSNLTQHLRIHTSQKPHKCQLCNKSFSFKSSLTQHLMIHNGQKPHKCNVCKKCFNQKITLNQHLMIHTGEKPHKCNVCNKSFRQKIHLSIHLKIHQN